MTEDAVAMIRKKYGDDALFMPGDKPMEIEYIPTGSLALDKAIGIGGIPVGRVIEMYGPNGAGKTTLALEIVANAQRKFPDKYTPFIDVEYALDVNYARRLGIDMNRMPVSQPANAESAMGIIQAWAESGQASVIVLDSVAKLSPRAEIEGEPGDSHMGLLARLMGQSLRRLDPALAQTATTLVAINQIRMKIGVPFGNPETTPGGMALAYSASVRIDLRKKAMKAGDEVVGDRVTAKIVKNKVAPPFRVAEYTVKYGEGIDKWDEMVDIGSALEVITKRGAFFSYEDTRLGQGKANAAAFLKEHPELAAEIDRKIRTSDAVVPVESLEE